MSVSGKINRWNAAQFSSHAQLQFHRERRAVARAEIAKINAQAGAVGSAQMQQSIGLGDISSRAAMARMVSKKA
jgi:hypothetical protein